MSESFTVRADSLLRDLRTQTGISRAYFPKWNGPHHPPIQFNGIWDTGATGSVISQRVVSKCDLKPIGMVEVHTARGKCDCETYLINLTLPNKVIFSYVKVTKTDLGPDFDVLIGMDIITRGDFAVTNKDGKTCFSFRVPSFEVIDFLQEPANNKP